MTTQGIAGRHISYRTEEAWLLAMSLCGPFRCLDVVASNEMCDRRDNLHQKRERIERTEPHRSRNMVDCDVGVAKKGSYPATGVPRRRQIRIESERTIDQRYAPFQIAGHIAERQPAGGQRDGIILAQFGRAPRQTRAPRQR
jgi:hypothetical protein